MALGPANHASYDSLNNDIVRERKFPYPYSVEPLPLAVRHGIVPIGIVALLSVGSSLTLIGFIFYRLFAWRAHYRTFLGYNQYVILVLNLLLADLQQSAAFLVSFHWIRIDAILAPSSACFGQAWLLHSGDVASAFFVLLIALHTFITAVYGRRIQYRSFLGGIVAVWVLAYFLTLIGVLLHGDAYFTRAGSWCWVSPAYEVERLLCHYLWVFIVQFGTVLVYVLTYAMLRTRTRALFKDYECHGQEPPNGATLRALKRIAHLMTLYPCIYLVLTLPLSAGRMYELHTHKNISVQFQCVAGALLCSCGWVDSLLYTLTRKRLLRDTMPEGPDGAPKRRLVRSKTVHAVEGDDDGDEQPLGISVTQTQIVTVEDQNGEEMPYEAWHGQRANASDMPEQSVIEGRGRPDTQTSTGGRGHEPGSPLVRG